MKPELVHRPAPAPLVAECPRQPALPATFVDEGERYTWALKAIAAGKACRSAHDKLSEWVKNPPG